MRYTPPPSLLTVPVGADPRPLESPARAVCFVDEPLHQSLDSIVVTCPTLDALLTRIADIVRHQCKCLGLWACQVNSSGEFGPAHCLVQDGDSALWELTEDHAREMMERVASTRQLCHSTLDLPSIAELVVAPVTHEFGSSAAIETVLVGCFSASNPAQPHPAWIMGLVSQSAMHWFQHRKAGKLEMEFRTLSDSAELIHALDQTQSVAQAAVLLVNQIRRVCQSSQVALSLSGPSGKSTLAAISDVEQFDAAAESNRIIRDACHQAARQKQPIHFPDPSEQHALPSLALEKYCNATGIEACINHPLITVDGRTIGSLLLGVSSEQIKSDSFKDDVSRIIDSLTGHLDIVLRANRGMRALMNSRWQRFRSSKLTRTIGVGLACIAALLFVPINYSVPCDLEIQPVMRRFIASPHDGILKNTLIQKGDVVLQNQIVAHLEGHQLRIELSGCSAELEGASKRRDSALALGNIAESQIARSEMKRHQSKIDILNKRLEQLIVRSPIAGIVVSGDLEKVEGAPLEMGQALFEIAPLDQMLAEVGIPESEIPFVEPGMQVTFKLNAFPFKTWTGTIERIHPCAELIDDESVFVAQVVLPNQENQLRPGMKGSAKIHSRPAPIGWCLFHRPWESVRYWLIW